MGETLDENQVVVFGLGNEEFGVPIAEVKEIIRLEEITKIPNTEQYIKGVINIRGGIIVVIDLAMKLGFPQKEPDKDSRILVIEVGKNTVGMIVDSATEVLRLDADQKKDPPQIITEKIDVQYLNGVGILGERLLILLDLAKILGSTEMKKIEEAKNTHSVQPQEAQAPVSEPESAHPIDAVVPEAKPAEEPEV